MFEAVYAEVDGSEKLQEYGALNMKKIKKGQTEMTDLLYQVSRLHWE